MVDDRRKYMDEGTRAIIQLAIEENAKENRDYFDGKFLKLEEHVGEIKSIVDNMMTKGCLPCIAHKEEHKDTQRKTIKTVTIISTLIPTAFIVGSWLKSMVIGWIENR